MDISVTSTPAVSIPNQTNLGVSGTDQTTISIAPAAASAPNTDTAAVAHNVPSAENIAKAVKQANESFAQRGQNLYASFEKDKATGINVVKIVDKRTNETVSQMPIKEMVAFAEFLEHPQGVRGGLINTTA